MGPRYTLSMVAHGLSRWSLVLLLGCAGTACSSDGDAPGDDGIASAAGSGTDGANPGPGAPAGGESNTVSGAGDDTTSKGNGDQAVFGDSAPTDSGSDNPSGDQTPGNQAPGSQSPGGGDPPTAPPMDQAWQPDYWPTEAWQTKAPEELGYDPDTLADAVAFATESNTQALLVIQDGYIISEDYFAGFAAEERHESFSMAKSYTSGLVGIALEAGLIPDGVDTRICEFYEAWDCDDTSDPRSKITLEHLLTLTSGLTWTEDWSSAGSLSDNDAVRMSTSGSPVEYVLAKASARDPGTGFQYSTGDPALITGVLQAATGMTALAYAREKVLDPIGATTTMWNSDSQGRTTTFAGMQATARDYARYGFLFLNRGQWDGKQLIPAAWVDLSTRPGRSLEPWYGYLWHVDLAAKFEDPQLPSDGYTAKGVQGQLITVIPSERMVIVRLANDPFGSDIFDGAGLYNRILAAKH